MITQLEKLLRDAAPDQDILTCADFAYLNAECCPTCHFFMFPYDMCSAVKLRSGEYAWLCCAIGNAVKSASGREISAKRKPPDETAKSAGYKPFADFFGGSNANNDK